MALQAAHHGGLGLPREATNPLCGTAELPSAAQLFPARALPRAEVSAWITGTSDWQGEDEEEMAQRAWLTVGSGH